MSSDLMHMGCLKPDNTDVEPFVVNECVYFAELSSGLKKHHYWTPAYGAACIYTANTGFSFVSAY